MKMRCIITHERQKPGGGFSRYERGREYEVDPSRHFEPVSPEDGLNITAPESGRTLQTRKTKGGQHHG